MDILVRFAPKLESLRLALIFSGDTCPIKPRHDNVAFPVLKTLKDSNSSGFWWSPPGDVEVRCPFYPELIYSGAAPNLEIVTMRESTYFFCQNLNLLRNINTLEITVHTVSADNLIQIRNASWPLKTLRLKIEHNDEYGKQCLIQLLESNASTLEHLTWERSRARLSSESAQY